MDLRKHPGLTGKKWVRSFVHGGDLQKEEIYSFAFGLVINISSKKSMVHTHVQLNGNSKLIISNSLLDSIRKQPGGNMWSDTS